MHIKSIVYIISYKHTNEQGVSTYDEEGERLYPVMEAKFYFMIFILS